MASEPIRGWALVPSLRPSHLSNVFSSSEDVNHDNNEGNDSNNSRSNDQQYVYMSERAGECFVGSTALLWSLDRLGMCYGFVN